MSVKYNNYSEITIHQLEIDTNFLLRRKTPKNLNHLLCSDEILHVGFRFFQTTFVSYIQDSPPACWVRSLTFALHCFVSAKIWVSFARWDLGFLGIKFAPRSKIPAGKTTSNSWRSKGTSISDSLQLDETLANIAETQGCCPSSNNYISKNTLADIFCDLTNSKAAVMFQSHPLQRLYQVPVSNAAPASQQVLGSE